MMQIFYVCLCIRLEHVVYTIQRNHTHFTAIILLFRVFTSMRVYMASYSFEIGLKDWNQVMKKEKINS